MTTDRSGRDWHAWHQYYDADGSPLARRLETVQRRIRDALDACPLGPIRVVSMCTGEARDLLGVVDGHPRAHDVHARLVELDPALAARARERALALGLAGVDVLTADASATSAYADAVPADVVLVCGVFGNISDGDVANTVRMLPSFCAPSATLVWTRHRNAPDLTTSIRTWCRDAGFTEVAFDAPDDTMFGVGTFRYDGPPVPFVAGERMFTFVGGGVFGQA